MTKQWPKVKLGTVLQPVKRSESVDPAKTYRLLGIRLDGNGPFLRESVSGAQTAASKLNRVEAGDFIYSRLFACRGAFGLIEHDLHDCYVSGEFPTFRAVESEIDLRFLRFWFRLPSVIRRVDEDCTGSTPLTRNRYKENFFLDLEIPLPPLDEQQRIVAYLDALSAKITQARTLRQQATEETSLVAGNKIRALFEHGQESGWGTGCLGDYVINDRYGTSDKTHNDGSGVPVLRMGNIQNGRLDIRDLKYLHIADKEREKLILKRGDILVNRTNSAELVGKCAVFNLAGDFAYASYLIRLRLDTERADPSLVARFINSPVGRAYMFDERKQMTGQANVNATKLKALPIALPPIEEQRRILAKIDALQARVDALRRAQAETAAELEALQSAALDRAFKGEL